MRCYSEKDVGLYKTSWHIASKFSAHTGCTDFGVVFTSRVNAFLLLFGSICHEEGFGFPLCGGSDLMWGAVTLCEGQWPYVRGSDLMWGAVPLCEGQWPYVRAVPLCVGQWPYVRAVPLCEGQWPYVRDSAIMWGTVTLCVGHWLYCYCPCKWRCNNFLYPPSSYSVTNCHTSCTHVSPELS